MSIEEYLEKLQTHIASLEQKDINTELSDSLSEEIRAGLHMILRVSINRLVAKMNSRGN